MQLPLVSKGLDVPPWPPILATRGPGSIRTLHSHHAMHCVLALSGELRVRTSRTGRWSSAAGVLTAPDCPHAIDTRGVEMLVIFFDPESHVGAGLRPAIKGSLRLISSAERAELVRGADDPLSFVRMGADEWSRRAASTFGLLPRVPSRVPHPAVGKLLERLRNSGLDEDVSLEGLAQALGLSGGRLMHVFTESIGIPLRPYLSWLRVQRAACALLAGNSVTEAAHLAGFADASHLCRTFKRRLGVTPSALRPMQCSESAQLSKVPHPGARPTPLAG